jgi:iron complex outermembrane receptor protein
LSIEGAARYENYSDFGSNLDKKAALAYRPHEDVLLRASASTGFRAPSLSQAYYTSTVSTLSSTDATFRQAGTFAVNHPVSVALGSQALRPEKSRHQTVGMVRQPDLYPVGLVSGLLIYPYKSMLNGVIQESFSVDAFRSTDFSKIPVFARIKSDVALISDFA